MGDRARGLQRGGNAWDYFTHDQARSRAYRWGEDGLAGICDERQRLCFALSMWNGKDPILKERLFGLTNAEGNHGEDVKEYYFYLDSTPTHSYMRYLYKYPQAAYPYDDLVRTNRTRGRQSARVRAARHRRVRPGPLLRRVRRIRQGLARGYPDPLHGPQPWAGLRHARPAAQAVVPQRVVLACRRGAADARAGRGRPGRGVVRAVHPQLGTRYLYCDGDVPLLFTENETNTQRIFGVANQSAYVKDGINDYVVHGRDGAVNPEKTGTIVAAHYRLTIGPGESPGRAPAAVGRGARCARAQQACAGQSVRRRIRSAGRRPRGRRRTSSTPRSFRPRSSADGANVMRQALAGMLWSKQYYRYDVHQWLKEHGSDPFNPIAQGGAAQ